MALVVESDANPNANRGGDPSSAVAISVRDLSFAFPDRRTYALRNISLDIVEGEFVVITGASGCGKSTLALALAGYIPHVIEGTLSGEIVVGGIKTVEAALCDLAVTVSLCQQDPESQLCTLSVQDEVCFGPENLALPVAEVLRRKDDALAAMGLSDLLGRDVLQLSGGEKQRVTIASMLAMHPRVLILDEPTSNLDPDAAEEVLASIETLRRENKLTIIIIEHKLDRLLKTADRLIVMADGEISLDGRPAEIYPRYVASLGGSEAFPTPPGAEPAPEGDMTLQARDLWFKYGERDALRGVSLTVRGGEFVGIIGANGSGKTTFLNCLAGMSQPSSGEVELEGGNVRGLKLSAIARRMGFVFQNPNHQIFENTVGDEIAFACRNFGFGRDAIEKLVRGIMDDYGMAAYERSHPLRLSHGEKRRLNLCSILPHDPSIIILDEPFIGQDDANTARMISALLHLKASGHTVLIVSHDMDLVFRYCSRVLLFDEGKIVVDARPERARDQITALGKRNFLPGAL